MGEHAKWVALLVALTGLMCSGMTHAVQMFMLTRQVDQLEVRVDTLGEQPVQPTWLEWLTDRIGADLERTFEDVASDLESSPGDGG